MLHSPAAASVTPVTPSAGSQSANPNQPQPLAGRIAAVGNNTTIHGYLSLTPDSDIDLTTDRDREVRVSFSPGRAYDVLHLAMGCRVWLTEHRGSLGGRRIFGNDHHPLYSQLVQYCEPRSVADVPAFSYNCPNTPDYPLSQISDFCRGLLRRCL